MKENQHSVRTSDSSFDLEFSTDLQVEFNLAPALFVFSLSNLKYSSKQPSIERQNYTF